MIINISVFIIAVILLFAAPCFFLLGFYSLQNVPQNLDKRKDKSSKLYKSGIKRYVYSMIALVLGVTLLVILINFLDGFDVFAFCFKPVFTILLTSYFMIAITLLQSSEKQEPDTTPSNFSIQFSKIIYIVGLIANVAAIFFAYFLIFEEGTNKTYGWYLVAAFIIVGSFLIYAYKRKKIIVYYGQIKSRPLFGSTKVFLLSNILQAEIKTKYGEPYFSAYDRNHKKLFAFSCSEMKNSDIMLDYLHNNGVKMIDKCK